MAIDPKPNKIGRPRFQIIVDRTRHMNEEADKCAYSVDLAKWKGWGGSAGMWRDLLDKSRVDGDIWTCPHPVVNEGMYCVFHTTHDDLPAEVNETKRLREALSKSLQRTEGAYRYRQFLGAKFRSVDIQYEFAAEDEYPVVFAGATFEQDVNFRGTVTQLAMLPVATFRGEVDCSNVTFGRGADFRKAKFDHKVVFRGAEFTNGWARFSGAIFSGWANFRRAIFNDLTEFSGDAMFENGVDFNGATFKDVVLYSDTTFEDHVGFREVTFEDVVSFARTTVNCEVCFQGAKFEDEVSFEKAVFRDDAVFAFVESGKPMRAVFSGPADFTEATFNGEAIFSVAQKDGSILRTKFEKAPEFTKADLEGAEFSHLNLINANFHRANLTDATFTEACLWGTNCEQARFNRATFYNTDLRGTWLSGALLGDVRVNEETKLLHPPVNNLPIESYLPLSVASIFPGVAQRIPSCGYDPKFVPPNGTNDSLSWPEPDLNKAKSVYRALENLASLSSRPRLQSRAFVRRQDIQRNLYSKAAEAADTKEMIVNRGRWMRTLIARGFLLYGESPWRGPCLDV